MPATRHLVFSLSHTLSFSLKDDILHPQALRADTNLHQPQSRDRKILDALASRDSQPCDSLDGELALCSASPALACASGALASADVDESPAPCALLLDACNTPRGLAPPTIYISAVSASSFVCAIMHAASLLSRQMQSKLQAVICETNQLQTCNCSLLLPIEA
jgi:hypothetical protein